MAAELDRLTGLVTSDREAAFRLLEELWAQTNRALDAMRDLSHGLFPALLSDRGLPTALESFTQHGERPVILEISPETRGIRLAPEQEAAGYFCCVEALSGLDQGSIRLGIQQGRLEIRSGGRLAGSFHADLRQRLVDRVEAVGGSVQLELDATGQLLLRVQFPLDSDAHPKARADQA